MQQIKNPGPKNEVIVVGILFYGFPGNLASKHSIQGSCPQLEKLLGRP
jgi:hypothetical protein